MTTTGALVITCLLVFLAGDGRCQNDNGVIISGEVELLSDHCMDLIKQNSQNVSLVEKMSRTKPGNTVKPSDVTFKLFTRDGHSVLDLRLRKPPTFRSDRETKILIHGFLSSGKIYEGAARGYLLAEDYNVIIVDWSHPARCWHKNAATAVLALCYGDAVNYHISSVGRLLAQLLDILFTKSEVDNIHIIGHSLGAHVAGIAGARHIVGRITGLDPAAPFFDSSNQALVLSKHDAKFVDVIHTCVGFFGWTSPLGHADFYPNDGKSPQPGCKFPSDIFKTCSHARAYEYYTESVKGNYFYEFAATPCEGQSDVFVRRLCSGESTNVMGEHTTARARGIFYVETAPRSPFAIIFGSSNCVTPRSSVIFLLASIMHILSYWQ